MPRTMRALIVIVVVTVIGLSALAWMARRYATMIPPPAGSSQR